MPHEYKCTVQQFFHEDIGSYTSYGIKLEGNNFICVQDISVNKAFVDALVDKLNRYQLEPIHLYDVIEDALTE